MLTAIKSFTRLQFIVASAMLPLGMAECPFFPPPPSDSPSGTVQLGLALVTDGLVSPVGMAVPDDGSGRLFVIDQIGHVRVIDSQGNLLGTPFLDVSDRMVQLMAMFDERGLLGLAFHPDYVNNGRFFVVYNAPLAEQDPQDFDSRWRLSEFRRSDNDANLADPNSEQILLEVLKPQFNHNGGQLAFGPDGMLYASIGDGGGANDVGDGHNPTIGNGQDLATRLGKILRFDVDTPGTLNIPGDNPFIDDPSAVDAIFAFGLRNPWRFSFDSGGANRLFCADAGQELYEEVSIVEAGENLGWNIREGNECFDPANPAMPPAMCSDTGANGEPLVDPIIAYSHFDQSGNVIRLVVVGGYVYRGSAMPSLVGDYIFGDWSSSFLSGDGTIFVADENADGTWTFEQAEITTEPDGQVNRYVLAFGQDNEGEVYVLTSLNGGPSGNTGAVYRIVAP